jgi:hypothetical protein
VIIVKRPAGEVVAENTVVIPDPVMARKYQEALGQLKILQSATPQSVRTQIKEVVVERLVDNPDLVAKLQNANDHIAALERVRIDLQSRVMAKTPLPAQMPPERVEIQTIKVVISKAWTLAAAMGGAGLTFLLTRLLHVI